MRAILSLILTVSIFTISPGAHAQDPKATPIIQKLNEKLRAAKSIQANFNTIYNSAKGVTKSSFSGALTIKGSKYIIDMGSHKIYNNGSEVYTYLVNAKEVQVSKYHAAADPISPASLFSGNFTQDFTYSYIGERTIAGRKVHQIELKPKKANTPYVRLELFIDVAKSEVSGGNVFEKSGNFYTIAITSLNMNAQVPDAAFTLDTKSLNGVEVIYLD